LVKVLIANVKTLIDNIITNTKFLTQGGCLYLLLCCIFKRGNSPFASCC
jgi:hypothetical protein